MTPRACDSPGACVPMRCTCACKSGARARARARTHTHTHTHTHAYTHTHTHTHAYTRTRTHTHAHTHTSRSKASSVALAVDGTAPAQRGAPSRRPWSPNASPLCSRHTSVLGLSMRGGWDDDNDVRLKAGAGGGVAGTARDVRMQVRMYVRVFAPHTQGLRRQMRGSSRAQPLRNQTCTHRVCKLHTHNVRKAPLLVGYIQAGVVT